MDVGSNPTVALDCRNDLGESIVWDNRSERLWWVNIHAREIWGWSPGGGSEPVVDRLDRRVGALGLRQTGGLALALEDGFATYAAGSGVLDGFVAVEADLPTTRLNDGRIDPRGRFVCGGMDEGAPQRHISAVYSHGGGGAPRSIIQDVGCSNSICWSPDGSVLYFTDMPTRRIDAFDYDLETGAVSNRRTFVDLGREPGLADGSTVDAEGCLWNAQWGGGKVVRYTPDGKIDREIRLPVTNPTCLCFGGPALEILYITTARFGLDDKTLVNEPHAGSVFALKPGVTGLPEHRFAG
jgi:L-arabinonolactonase